jgi:predicted glycoside hydrolase/deacetylase ChbG (UPF0249 family)
MPGTSPSDRRLIVNADDFGQADSINQGIIQAFEHGIVTSASLMVRFPATTAAAEFARRCDRLSVGLHLDLGEWTCRDGQWTQRYSVVTETDAQAVVDEVERQLTAFRQLLGRDPTHFDSHQHVHRSEPLLSILLEAGHRLGIPVRHFGPVLYRGDFYGQTNQGHPYPEGLTVDNLKRVISTLPAGVTELGCHPGVSDDMDSMYRAERMQELKTLCDPRIRECLAASGVELCSFHEFAASGVMATA